MRLKVVIQNWYYEVPKTGEIEIIGEAEDVVKALQHFKEFTILGMEEVKKDG